MTDRPMLFSGPLVRAILSGAKTQTRRPVTGRKGPIAEAGDRLWVRETWTPLLLGADEEDATWGAAYAADRSILPRRAPWEWEEREVSKRGPIPIQREIPSDVLWRPSILMPRWAARLYLAITAVRVESVADITEDDACAEGVTPEPGETHRDAFARVWADIYGAASWEDSHPVWRIDFTLETP